MTGGEAGGDDDDASGGDDLGGHDGDHNQSDFEIYGSGSCGSDLKQFNRRIFSQKLG